MELPDYEKRCEKILKKIEKLPGSKIFASPVDSNVYPNYVAIICNVMDFSTVRSKLGFTTSNGRLGRYSNHNEFAKDIRRCVGNFLNFNYDAETKVRRKVITILTEFEKLWELLEIEVNRTYPSVYFAKPLYKLSLYLNAFELCLEVRSVVPSNLAVAVFMKSIEVSLAPDAVQKYKNVVSQPMDAGLLIRNICEGVYSSVEQLIVI
jgi:hypothetical protein